MRCLRTPSVMCAEFCGIIARIRVAWKESPSLLLRREFPIEVFTTSDNSLQLRSPVPIPD